jgi:tripeptide aminopeptidase
MIILLWLYLLTLPDIIKIASIDLDCNLILLATTRSHGRGDFEGIRQFIKNSSYKVDSAINLSGLTLGTMNYFTRSRFRCDINCKVAAITELPQINIPTGHAILTINEIINNILKIPLPQKPWTNMNIGMIRGGERYSTPSREASIQLEALSEDDDILEKLKDEIQSMVVDIGAKHGSIVSTYFFGTLKKSEITSRHPLVRHTIDIISELGYTPKMKYVNSEIAVTLSENIPSVSLGITTGLGGSSSESYINIPPISKGVVQLLNLITRVGKDNQLMPSC